MAELPVETIRKSNRFELVINRKRLKDEESDLHRSLDKLRLTDIDLSKLANKLKNRSKVTVTDLQNLKNLLIQDEENIKLVLKTQGALRGLVRELTGNTMDRQVEAAGCLCNLALTDWRGSLSIISAAGVYLIAALESQNLQLCMTSAWALGNLCGAGATCAAALSGLGVLPPLCARLPSEAPRAEAAVYALTLYAHTMADQMLQEHLNMIIHAVGPFLCRNSIRLFYILSCHSDFSDPDNYVQSHLIYRFPDMMKWHYKSCVMPECCDVLLGIRTLANMERRDLYYNFLVYMHQDKTRISEFLQLVKDPRLKTSMLWLLGNMSWQRDPNCVLKKLIFNGAEAPSAPAPALRPPRPLPALPLPPSEHVLFPLEQTSDWPPFSPYLPRVRTPPALRRARPLPALRRPPERDPPFDHFDNAMPELPVIFDEREED